MEKPVILHCMMDEFRVTAQKGNMRLNFAHHIPW
jgi:hypothetical protein